MILGPNFQPKNEGCLKLDKLNNIYLHESNRLEKRNKIFVEEKNKNFCESVTLTTL